MSITDLEVSILKMESGPDDFQNFVFIYYCMSVMCGCGGVPVSWCSRGDQRITSWNWLSPSICMQILRIKLSSSGLCHGYLPSESSPGPGNKHVKAKIIYEAFIYALQICIHRVRTVRWAPFWCELLSVWSCVLTRHAKVSICKPTDVWEYLDYSQ